MEKTLDAVVEQLETMSDLTLEEGGFSDQVALPDHVWWGNPGVVAETQYPYLYVEPVISVPESETTGTKTRRETVRVVLLAEPAQFYDVTEVSESTASREMVRTMEAIERWFEKTSLRQPNGLFDGSSRLEVSTTEYAQQLRGTLSSLGAAIILSVDVKRSKS